MLRLLALSLLLASIQAFPSFMHIIPQGSHVPNPCGHGSWHGVGHWAAAGGGPLNPFGNDFLNMGSVWSDALCRMDSDGDGRTNGEELGDPNCMWTPDNHYHTQKASGHPGICEPLGSAECAALGSTFQC